MQPTFTTLNYTYKRNESNLWVLNFDDIPVPDHIIGDKSIVHFAPQSIGGNHVHPRIEWFIGVGEGLELFWLDNNNSTQSKLMNPKGELLLIEIPPMLPHAVKNTFFDKDAVLIEFANQKQSDVTPFQVIS